MNKDDELEVYKQKGIMYEKAYHNLLKRYERFKYLVVLCIPVNVIIYIIIQVLFNK